MGILWSASHETGDMSQWYSNSGGTESNSGAATSVASPDVAHTGSFSAKCTITSPPTAGVRLFRWRESFNNLSIPLFYSAWYFFPRVYTPAAWWGIFFFKSSDALARSHPFLYLLVGNRPNGNMCLRLAWWPSLWSQFGVEGPHQGEFGGREYTQQLKDLPVGQWVHVEVCLLQSGAFGGQYIVWQDGVELFNLSNVKTGYPLPGGYANWLVANYSDEVSPSPTVIYVDDAVVSTTRVGLTPNGPPRAPRNLRIIGA
jgi:hypothetical protein